MGGGDGPNTGPGPSSEAQNGGPGDANGGGGGGGGGPNPFTMGLTAPPTTDPAAALITMFSEGFSFNETILPRRFAIAFPLMEPETAPNAFDGCVVTFPPASTYSSMPDNEAKSMLHTLASSTHDFSGTVTFTGPPSPPRCTFDGVSAIRPLVKQFFAQMENITSEDQAYQLQSAVGSFSVREAFAGCKNLVQSMVEVTQVQKTIPGTTSCRLEYGTSEYFADPCCNWLLSYTSCW